jgi:ribosomal protein L30E
VYAARAECWSSGLERWIRWADLVRGGDPGEAVDNRLEPGWRQQEGERGRKGIRLSRGSADCVQFSLGYKEALKQLRSGRCERIAAKFARLIKLIPLAKLILISKNTPPLRKSEIEYYAML